MFDTETFRPINDLVHKTRVLQDKTINNQIKCNSPKLPQFNYKSSSQNQIKASLPILQTQIFKKQKQSHIVKIWQSQSERLFKNSKIKFIPFCASHKYEEILLTYQEIQNKNCFFIYPAGENSSIQIYYSEFIQSFLEANKGYIIKNLSDKILFQRLFRELCQNLIILNRYPSYNDQGFPDSKSAIQKLLKQKRLIHNEEYILNKVKNRISKKNIYEEKFKRYEQIMMQEDQEEARTDKQANTLPNLAKEEDIDSFLFKLNKEEAFTDKWNDMVDQRDLQNHQRQEENERRYNLGMQFKRKSRGNKLDKVLENIEKLKKQSQYMIKQLEERENFV